MLTNTYLLALHYWNCRPGCLQTPLRTKVVMFTNTHYKLLWHEAVCFASHVMGLLFCT